MKTLYVFLNAEHVGFLYFERGQLSFEYVEGVMTPLSWHLPIQAEAFEHAQVEAFFSGLLPDEPVRSHIARILKVSSRNTFGLLEQIGGDCAGAVRIVAQPNSLDKIQKSQALTEGELFSILKNLPQRPLGIGISGLRISGAGAQDKLMLTKVGDDWHLPLEGAPSTHIIKPNIIGFPHSVLNEYFCMLLAERLGLRVPHVEILELNGTFFYVIERYDRASVDGQVIRLHQEDFCQVLGIPPQHKYQNEGGPSIAQLFKVLRDFQQQGRMRGTETLRLLRLILFNFLIGNGDAHGKNFSVLYRGQHVELAPCYDLLSTLVYGNWHKETMAMKVASKYKFKSIAFHHFERMGIGVGLSSRLLRQEGQQLSKKIIPEAQNVLLELKKQGYPVALLEKIVSMIEKQSRIFL